MVSWESSLTFEDFVAWLENNHWSRCISYVKLGDVSNVMLVYRSVDFWKIEMMIQSSTCKITSQDMFASENVFGSTKKIYSKDVVGHKVQDPPKKKCDGSIKTCISRSSLDYKRTDLSICETSSPVRFSRLLKFEFRQSGRAKGHQLTKGAVRSQVAIFDFNTRRQEHVKKKTSVMQVVRWQVVFSDSETKIIIALPETNIAPENGWLEY